MPGEHAWGSSLLCRLFFVHSREREQRAAAEGIFCPLSLSLCSCVCANVPLLLSLSVAVCTAESIQSRESTARSVYIFFYKKCADAVFFEKQTETCSYCCVYILCTVCIYSLLCVYQQQRRANIRERRRVHTAAEYKQYAHTESERIERE